MDNTSPSKLNPKLLLIIGGVFLVILFFIIVLAAASKKNSSTNTTSQTTGSSSNSSGGGFFGFGGKSGNNSTSKTPTVKAIFNSKDDIAKTILSWINTQKDKDGKYLYGTVCTDATHCESPQDNPNGLAAIWGRYMYYKKNPNSDDLAIIKKDLSVYSNKEIVGYLQNSSWNCKLMYDLSQDKIFNTSEKQEIRNICFTSVYYVPDEINKANLQEADIPISDLSSLMNAFIKSTPSQNVSDISPNSLFNNYITAASDYVYMYKWEHNQINLKLAQFYFKKALQDYKLYESSLSDSSPKLGIAAMDLFSETKDNLYLSLAYNVHKRNANTTCQSLEQCYTFAILSNQIYGMTHSEKYMNYRNTTFAILMDNNLDYKGFKGYKFGKNAFYKDTNNFIYPVKDNAIVAGLLSNQ